MDGRARRGLRKTHSTSPHIKKDSPMTKTLASAALALLAATTAASAHVTLETGEATAGSAYKAIFRVPHGCDGSPTVQITVKIPEGMIAVKPMPHAGWTIETVKGKYARAYDYYGSQLDEGVTEVTWTGGNLPDAYYDEFVLRGMVAADLPAGPLYFPIVQRCERGVERWIEIPAPGQSAEDLEGPAPAVTIVPKP
jgi:uncharacterized protein YcnI